MATYKTEALIYKRKAFDDRNTVITAFTPSGKSFFKASNSLLKKIYLSPYAHVGLIASERSGMDRIYDSELIADFKQLAADLEMMKLAGYFYQIIDKLSIMDDPNNQLYQVLHKYLYLLKDKQKLDIKEEFEKAVLLAEGIYSRNVTNQNFEVIIDGYRKGVFHDG
jgi:recombinational DNA repair protein (RecF pathway)